MLEYRIVCYVVKFNLRSSPFHIDDKIKAQYFSYYSSAFSATIFFNYLNYNSAANDVASRVVD